MKLTTHQLKRIIMEELQGVLNEDIDMIAPLFVEYLEAWLKDDNIDNLKDNINQLVFMADSMGMDMNSLADSLSGHKAAKRATQRVRLEKVPGLSFDVPIIGIMHIKRGAERAVVNWDGWQQRIVTPVALPVAEALLERYRQNKISDIVANEVVWPLRHMKSLPSSFREEISAEWDKAHGDFLKDAEDDWDNIIKEELQGILNENSYEDALRAWDHKFSKEPQSWDNEQLQYLKMLLDPAGPERFLGEMLEDPSMFASILNYLKKTYEMDLLKKIRGGLGSYEELRPMFQEFWMDIIPKELLEELHRIYKQNYAKSDENLLINSERRVRDLISRYYKGDPNDLYSEVVKAVEGTNRLLNDENNEEVEDFNEFKEIILSERTSNEYEDEDSGEF